MATAPVNSPPLHNFPLSFLKWGHRCRRQPEPTAEVEERESEEEGVIEREKEERSWNLRPRRVAAAAADNGGAAAETVPAVKSARLRGISEGHVAERKNLWVSLSREEIEEDIYAMTGGRPARRPKKRAKIVQKQLEGIFPGLYLVGITVDAYRVSEATK